MESGKGKADRLLELTVVVLLGVTAVLTAYASWQSSLYGGAQAEKYTQGTAIISDANQLYNEAAQYIAMDMATWNTISDLRVDLEFANSKGDTAEVERLQYKLDKAMYDNVDENLKAGIDWADAQQEYASPFEKEGFVDSYYVSANAKYGEGENMIKAGSEANTLGDKLGLVVVIFAVVLFLLGMAAFFDTRLTKIILLAVSGIGFVIGTIMMLAVPMLTL